jgi:hypothetical protein
MNKIKRISNLPHRNELLPAFAARVSTPWEEYIGCKVQERWSLSGKKTCYDEYCEAISRKE